MIREITFPELNKLSYTPGRPEDLLVALKMFNNYFVSPSLPHPSPSDLLSPRSPLSPSLPPLSLSLSLSLFLHRYVCGSVGYYNIRKEKSVSVRYPQVLSKCTKIFNSVTTSDDPVIEKVLLNVIKIIYNLLCSILCEFYPSFSFFFPPLPLSLVLSS